MKAIGVLLLTVGIIFAREMANYGREAFRDWRMNRLQAAEYLPASWKSSQGERLGQALAGQRRERQTPTDKR